MRNVLVIAPYPYLPYYSGGQKSIAQFLHWLGKEVSLTVVTVAGTDPSLAKTYSIAAVLKKSFSRYYDRSLVGTLTELVQKKDIDTIIWEHPYYAWLAKRIKQRTGVHTILHTHNIEYQRFHSTGRWWWPILRFYEKWAFRQADLVFFVSSEDKQFAIREWKIDPSRCIQLAFGVEIKQSPEDKAVSKERIAQHHHIPVSAKLILFNGLLNYGPNLEAVKVILSDINPILYENNPDNYRLIICGKGLPKEMKELKDYEGQNIIYAGFVDDIETYFKAADVFLNPIQSGGGVKTKLVEAIAFGTTVISTETGASGIERDLCGQKLITVADHNWPAFADAIINAPAQASTPAAFYEYYHWGNIIHRTLTRLAQHSPAETKDH